MKRLKKGFVEVIAFIAVDVFSIWLGFYLSFLIKTKGSIGHPFSLYSKAIPIIAITLIIIMALRRVYTKSYLSFLDEMLDSFIAFLIVSLVFMSFTFVYKIGPVYSRLIVGSGFLLGFVFDLILRFLIRIYFAKTNISTRNVLIVGAGRTGEVTIDALGKMFLSPRKIVGILDDGKAGTFVRGVRVIGKLSDLEDILSKGNIDELVFAITQFPLERLSKIEKICDKFNVVFKIVPNVFGFSIAGARLEEIRGVLLLELTRNKIVGFNAFMKRMIDIIISIVALIILSPLFIIISILIKIDSKGPVFFKHKRIGQYGKPFYCIKFRTMVVNAEQVLKELLEKDPVIREEFLQNFKLKNDPRVTRIGRILRKTSLDEMPQIINVLKGEMSVIGPRPIVEKEMEKYGDYKELLLQIKPGMAGLWVANGRNDIDYKERILMDAYYIKNWSLWLDVKIFINSALSVIKRKGAY